jgi:mono/diheme cytochrome c family protein
MKRILFACMILLICQLLNSGCGNNDREAKEKQNVTHKENTEPKATTSQVTLSYDEFEGMKLFMRHCNKCHPGGEKGRGPSLNDKSLPNFLVHWQVRLGGGDMPKFTDEQISKAQLKQITVFVKRMQEMTHG